MESQLRPRGLAQVNDQVDAIRGDERRRLEELLERLVSQGERLLALGESQLALAEAVRAQLALAPGADRRRAHAAPDEPRHPLLDRTGAWQRRSLEVRTALLDAVRARGVPVTDLEDLNDLLARRGLQGLVTAVIQEALTLQQAAARLEEATCPAP